MSKAVRGAIVLLAALLLISIGVAVMALLSKQTLEQDNQSLQAKIEEYQTKETKLLAQAKKLEQDQQELTERIKEKDKERDQLQQSYEEVKSKIDELNDQVASANQERDDFRSRVDTLRKERDDLMEKLKNQKEKIVEKIVYRDREPAGDSSMSDLSAEQSMDNGETPSVTAPKGDVYWAGVLKEKAALQLNLDKAKADLDQSMLQVVELKKQNAEIQLDLKNIKDEKEELEKNLQRDKEEYERKIKYNEDLANSLSVEVARARTDQKESLARAEKFKQDAMQLQTQIKQLSTTKLALEKTIAQINQDKTVIQKKLTQTEGVIQSRIDEIWQIKQNLDQKITQLPGSRANTEVELPPIIVNPSVEQTVIKTQAPVTITTPSPVNKAVAPAQEKNQPAPAAKGGKTQGTIISINEPNNFVIIDLGENDGSQVGRPLAVYRDNKQIGSLEVIQARKDISAADIKQVSGKLRVGDNVRY